MKNRAKGKQLKSIEQNREREKVSRREELIEPRPQLKNLDKMDLRIPNIEIVQKNPQIPSLSLFACSLPSIPGTILHKGWIKMPLHTSNPTTAVYHA